MPWTNDLIKSEYLKRVLKTNESVSQKKDSVSDHSLASKN